MPAGASNPTPARTFRQQLLSRRWATARSRANVRVIAATHQNLEAARAQGRPVPRGFVPPPQRHPPAPAAAARTPRRHSACWRVYFLQKQCAPISASSPSACRKRRIEISGRTSTSRAMCVSLRTSATGSPSWLPRQIGRSCQGPAAGAAGERANACEPFRRDCSTAGSGLGHTAQPRRRPRCLGRPRWPARRSRLLAAGEPDVWDALTRRFEANTDSDRALNASGGRRIEAAQNPRHRPQHHHPQDSRARSGALSPSPSLAALNAGEPGRSPGGTTRPAALSRKPCQTGLLGAARRGRPGIHTEDAC